MIIRFEDCVLDLRRLRLTRGGVETHVEPQVFDLLVLLANRSGEVVSKDEMVATVWKGLAVSDATISARISAARAAVGDDGKQQRIIRTVHRRGVSMTAEVRRDDVDTGTEPVLDRVDDPEPVAVRYTMSRDGSAIAWAAAGEGPPLIRIGRWLSHLERDRDSLVWGPLIHRLESRHRVIRYDLRGTGLSQRSAPIGELEPFVEDLAAVADAAGAQRFSVFAASQAVPVAIAYAVANPGRVDRLVLYGGYAEGRAWRTTSAGEVDEATALAMVRNGWGQRGSAFLKQFSMLFIPDSTPEQFEEFLNLQIYTASPETAVALRQAIDRFRVTEVLGQVRAPTLVLHCEDDSIHPLSQAQKLAAGIPGAHLVRLEGRNHMPLPQTPEWSRMMDEVDRFLG